MRGECPLEIVELETSGPRRFGPGTRLIGRVRLDEPVSSPVGSLDFPPEAGGRLLQLRLAFVMERVSSRSEYVSAFVCLRFHDSRVEALELRATPDETAGVSVLRPGVFGWSLGDPGGRSPVSLSCEAYALVRVPAGVEELSGSVRVDATIARAGWAGTRHDHARGRHTPEFVLRVPQEWSAEPETPSGAADTRAGTGTAAVRLCVAADTERYSRFRVPEAVRAQQRFVAALASARRHAGVAEAEVDLQESGDGQFAILPPGVDESVVIPRLVEGIRLPLAEVNSDLSDRARLRLRVALHRGHVRPGMNGWVGGATTVVHRLLDSDALREALSGAPDADFALIVSEVVYHDVIADHYGRLDPADFAEVVAKLEAKDFAERAWVHVPGSP